ncbi:MAG TPA: ERCC4 domain-containing protein [Pseudonocardia sp.]|jgi:ERCC4-type nuclease
MVFWQSPRTRKQARPDVRLPAARAAGIAELEILVDSRERYAYRFAGKPVRAISRALSCGDYAVTAGAKLVAAVERKSLPDLVSSLSNGRLRFALGELAALPRAAVVVEERYSRVFAQTGSARRRSPTGWPSCRSAGRPSRSCSVRPARWPRNGPTATSPPPTNGQPPRTLP